MDQKFLVQNLLVLVVKKIIDKIDGIVICLSGIAFGCDRFDPIAIAIVI